MSKQRLNLVVIPPSTGRVKQYSLPQWIGRAVIAAAVTLVVGSLASLGLATYGLSKANRQQAQVKENTDLKAQLASINGDVAVLRKQLARLEDVEKSVRTVFGFPEIDPEERQLGVGGDGVAAELTGSPATDAAHATQAELDGLLRRCSFERNNYETVLQSLMDRKMQLDHTPSIFPVNGYLARGFGIKPDPFTGFEKMHTGLDLATSFGTPIYAPAAGRVILRENQTQFGNVVAIEHGYGIETYYGHMSRFAVKLNDVIHRGDLIGYVGTSGHSTGPHLHYEVRVGGQAVDPMKYIYDRAPEPNAPIATTGSAD
ncbi:MAG: M23 family metallopeptidase [candidate division Zixibacteria bacterium]|nr:M23 family metallopeptidase [candidate division Zixibacteria bacterium]